VPQRFRSAEGRARATPGSWAIHGDEIIDISGRRIRVDEVVPYSEVSASPDGYFWRCHTVESQNYDMHGHANEYSMARAAASLRLHNRCDVPAHHGGVCRRLAGDHRRIFALAFEEPRC
jgi:hypothetical protein